MHNKEKKNIKIRCHIIKKIDDCPWTWGRREPGQVLVGKMKLPEKKETDSTIFSKYMNWTATHQSCHSASPKVFV